MRRRSAGAGRQGPGAGRREPASWACGGGRRRGTGGGAGGRNPRAGGAGTWGSLTASEEEDSAQLVFSRAPSYLYSGLFVGAVPDPAAPTNAFVGAVPDPTAPTNIFYFFKL